MNEDGKRPWRTALIALALVALLYVLSVGPAAKLNKMGIVSGKCAMFYRPLSKLVDRSPAADRFFTWYIGRLWRCDDQ